MNDAFYFYSETQDFFLCNVLYVPHLENTQHVFIPNYIQMIWHNIFWHEGKNHIIIIYQGTLCFRGYILRRFFCPLHIDDSSERTKWKTFKFTVEIKLTFEASQVLFNLQYLHSLSHWGHITIFPPISGSHTSLLQYLNRTEIIRQGNK